MITWDEFQHWFVGGTFTLLASVLGIGIKILITRLSAQDKQLATIMNSMVNLDQKVGLDLRGLDVRLSFIEGQLGIKRNS